MGFRPEDGSSSTGALHKNLIYMTIFAFTTSRKKGNDEHMNSPKDWSEVLSSYTDALTQNKPGPSQLCTNKLISPTHSRIRSVPHANHLLFEDAQSIVKG